VGTIGKDRDGYKVQPPHHSLERITCLAFSPDNVHQTGVSPGGQSGSAIVAAEAEYVERTQGKTWSRARSEVFVPYRRQPHCLLPSVGDIHAIRTVRHSPHFITWFQAEAWT
jgi:hypothetical protein